MRQEQLPFAEAEGIFFERGALIDNVVNALSARKINIDTFRLQKFLQLVRKANERHLPLTETHARLSSSSDPFLHCSVSTVRRIINFCLQHGFITARENYARHGVQEANSYWLAPAGMIAFIGGKVGVHGEQVGVHGEQVGVHGEQVGVHGEQVGVHGEHPTQCHTPHSSRAPAHVDVKTLYDDDVIQSVEWEQIWESARELREVVAPREFHPRPLSALTIDFLMTITAISQTVMNAEWLADGVAVLKKANGVKNRWSYLRRILGNMCFVPGIDTEAEATDLFHSLEQKMRPHLRKYHVLRRQRMQLTTTSANKGGSDGANATAPGNAQGS